MRPELVVLTLTAVTFAAIIFGAINLVTVKRFEAQNEEAEQIFRQRFFGDDEKTKTELGKFFRKARRHIFGSALSFMLAFVLVIMLARKLWPTDSIPKTIVSLVILLVIFGLPLTVLTLAGKQMAWLKKDIMRRFNAQ